MNTSSRFAVAVHILAGLAIIWENDREKTTSSGDIAWSVNTNPVVVRRILGKLKKAGLVHSKEGVIGGSRLARSPGKITLLHVYNATDDGSLFNFHASPNKDCPVGANIKTALTPAFSVAQSAMQRELEKITIKQIGDNIRKLTQK